MVLDLFMGLVAMRLDNNLMMCFVLGVFILRAWASLSLMPEVTTEYSYRSYKYIGYLFCLFWSAYDLYAGLTAFQSGLFCGVVLTLLVRTLYSMWDYIRRLKDLRCFN